MNANVAEGNTKRARQRLGEILNAQADIARKAIKLHEVIVMIGKVSR